MTDQTNQTVAADELTDAEIDAIADRMPGGMDGFLKGWGWRQFARAVLDARDQKGSADAARYRWLAPRLIAADFDWNDSGQSVLIFNWPSDVRVGASCDQNIDAAVTAEVRHA